MKNLIVSTLLAWLAFSCASNEDKKVAAVETSMQTGKDTLFTKYKNATIADWKNMSTQEHIKLCHAYFEGNNITNYKEKDMSKLIDEEIKQKHSFQTPVYEIADGIILSGKRVEK
jgi:flagellar basal body rod protein FlgF